MVASGSALYRAWRPRTFDDVVGQAHVVQTLRNAVRHGTLAHAYLFNGPRGTGKTSMARLLFKAANCLDPREGASCESCAICTSANAGRAIDLIEMDAASNRGIDDVRDLRDKIHFAPAEARYRVYILDEAHQFTQAAWDALLKTLEEPPPHAILVLATTEAHKVPATVVSRCQRFDFHRHSASAIRQRLALIAEEEGLSVEPIVLGWLAREARGGMRDAIGLLDQLRAFAGAQIDAAAARDVLGLAGLETVQGFLEALRDGRAADALEELDRAVSGGADLRVFIADVITYLRGLLLLRFGAGATLRDELPDEEVDWLEAQVGDWEAAQLRELVGTFDEAASRPREASQLLLQIELALLSHASTPAVARPRPKNPVLDPPAAQAERPEPTHVHDPESVSEAPIESIEPNDAPAALTAPSSPSTTSEDQANGTALSSGSSTTTLLQIGEMRDAWPGIRARIANTPAGMFWFNNCELQGLDGDTLVLKVDGALQSFLEGERRRALEVELAGVVGRVVRVRMVDEASPSDDPTGDDPVIRAGLRLFGGPLEAVEDPS